MLGRPDLARRRYERNGEPEIQFHYRDRVPKLPIWRDGQLQIARWGNGRGQSRFLPRTGWTWQESIEGNMWRNLEPLQVDIPATLGLDHGRWFTIDQGIRGLLVPDEHRNAVVYMICEPANKYYGTRAGERNPSFLDAETFERFFARPLRPYGERVGVLIFEFGTFNKTTFPTPGYFMGQLDPFLAALPEGFRYAVEIRNPEYLLPAYLELLASHNVAHVFNAWTLMRPGPVANRLHGGFHGGQGIAEERPGLRAGGQILRTVRANPGAQRRGEGGPAEDY